MSKTHFGFQSVDEQEKAQKVAGVFHSVAANYDLMNDLMSGGLHRAWKMFTIAQANVRPGYKVLDIAGGTGDLSKAFAKQAGDTGEVWHTDINESMLRVGRDRLLDPVNLVLVPTLVVLEASPTALKERGRITGKFDEAEYLKRLGAIFETK